MSNEHDPWGQPSDNKPPRRSDGNQHDGPPDLDELIQNLWKKFSGSRQGRKTGGTSEPPKQLPIMRVVFGIMAMLAIIWAGAGFYVLDEQERGVVLRLGKYNDTLNPGLQWQPYYIDNVITVNVTSLRDRFFDNTMITEDENIVEIKLQVQYVVRESRNFVLNLRQPENALSLATESALRHVVGSTNLDDVITTGRQSVADQVRIKTQSFLDAYEAGIDVRKVNVSSAKAPDEVKPAFDDVIKAREDKVRLVNQATAYENAVVPVARGLAERVLEDSRGYRESVIGRSKGDAERFLQLLAEYRKAPAVTKSRLYLNTMEQVLSNTSKVIIDVKDGNSLTYLPIGQILKQSLRNNSADSAGTVSSSSDLDKLSGSMSTNQDRILSRKRNNREGR